MFFVKILLTLIAFYVLGWGCLTFIIFIIQPDAYFAMAGSSGNAIKGLSLLLAVLTAGVGVIAVGTILQWREGPNEL